jgi:hypothetical protein
MLSFLDNIFKPIGKGLSEADTFMRREMPFNMSWGFPAALVASYFAPQVLGSMGGAGGSATGNSMLPSLGLPSGGFEGSAFALPEGVIPTLPTNTLGAGNAFGNLPGTGTSYGKLLDSMGIQSGGFEGVPGLENIFQISPSEMTPEYLNLLAEQQGVSQGDPTFFQRLTGQTEQGLYNRLPSRGMSDSDVMRMVNQANQPDQALQQLNQVRPQQISTPRGTMKPGEAVDATGALLSLLAANQPKTRVPRISLL